MMRIAKMFSLDHLDYPAFGYAKLRRKVAFSQGQIGYRGAGAALTQEVHFPEALFGE